MSRSWRNINWSDLLTFLFFFVFAALIWYGHAMHNVRTTRVPVLIQYTGKSGSIGLGSALPDTVLIEVQDAGERLNAYHREPLRLTIDLHSYIHGDKGTIHVTTDALRRSIADILQGTSKLIEITPEEITCPYFTEQEKSVVIAWRGDITPANEYQIVGKPVLNRTKITIYGSENALRKTDTIYTGYLSLSDLVDTTVVQADLAIPEGIRAETNKVDVRIIAERFTEKKFVLPLRAVGVPEGYKVRLFPHEVEVNVRMGMRHFAQVTPQDIEAVCVYTPDRKDKLDVELRYTNPCITAAWTYPAVVEYIIEQ